MIDLQARIHAIQLQARNRPAFEQQVFESLCAKAPFLLTDDQMVALRGFANFMADDSAERQLFILKGYAGTGKTTLTSLITKGLKKFGFNTYLMAPTGRAAKVMSLYSRKSAFTIHRTIFRTQQSEGGGAFKMALQKNYQSNTLFIVDEASMLACTGADNLLTHLLNYVFEHPDNKLLFVGDDAQLPPVSQPESLALDAEWIKRQYYMGVDTATLREVIRQKQESGILFNATMLRDQLSREAPAISFNTKSFADTFKMTGERLEEGIQWAYGKYGMESTLVVCRSNKTARIFNQYIRNRILHMENELDGGDLIMVVRNNYTYTSTASGFIANGDFARIRRVMRFEEMHDLHFADVELEMPDYPEQEPFEAKVLLDTLHSDQASLQGEQSQALYQHVLADYADLPTKRERDKAVKEDVYLNALQIKFAYALTCHKAQGGQWDAVFVDQGYLPDDTVTTDFLRWLYTACTRAKEQLFLVNFKEQFFAVTPVLEEEKEEE